MAAEEEVMVRTVATQAPSSLLNVTHGPSLALSSLAHAYKVDGGSSTYFQTGVPSWEQLREAVGKKWHFLGNIPKKYLFFTASLNCSLDGIPV